MSGQSLISASQSGNMAEINRILDGNSSLITYRDWVSLSVVARSSYVRSSDAMVCGHDVVIWGGAE